MMSLVIPFRFGTGDSLELKLSLRSWEKHSSDLVEDVYLIGDEKPTWYYGSTIPCDNNIKVTPICRVLKKLMIACEDPRITERFVYTNDDCFLVAPFKEGPFFMCNSPLREGGVHHRGFQLTEAELAKRGITKFLDCELHYPVIYEKSRCLKLLNEIDITQPYSFRTLYFNLINQQLAPERDHKRPDWTLPRPGEWCVSTSDNTIGQQKFIDWARREYPNKSRWEG